MTKNSDTTIKEYIIDCIINEDDENFDKRSRREKLYYLQNTFLKEFIHKNNVYSRKEFENYIRGLPSCLSIAFTDNDILQLSYHWRILSKDDTDKQKREAINSFWGIITDQTFNLFYELENPPTIDKTLKLLDEISKIKNPSIEKLLREYGYNFEADRIRDLVNEYEKTK